MTNPITHAFFLGRATAEVLSQELESSLTNLLGEVGKFDAEQRERLRQFTSQVVERAQQAEANAAQDHPTYGTASSSASTGSPSSVRPADLQATLDDLRAEIARLRAELRNHRTSIS
jgi:hypothetical protein